MTDPYGNYQHDSYETAPTAPLTYEALPPAAPTEPVIHPATVGVVAYFAALVLLMGTIMLSVYIGISAAPYAAAAGGGVNYGLPFDGTVSGASGLAIASALQWFGGSLIGLWALVQGIIAIATRRGRAYGVIALVLALLCPIVSIVVTLIAALSNLPS